MSKPQPVNLQLKEIKDPNEIKKSDVGESVYDNVKTPAYHPNSPTQQLGF